MTPAMSESAAPVFGDAPLRIEDVVALSRRQVPAVLSRDPGFRARIARGADFLSRLLEEEGVTMTAAVPTVNTGAAAPPLLSTITSVRLSVVAEKVVRWLRALIAVASPSRLLFVAPTVIVFATPLTVRVIVPVPIAAVLSATTPE